MTGSLTDTVVTDKGDVKGALLSGGVYAFLGIPYAAPPVGALRFRRPAEASAWKGVLQATMFGPVCPRLSTSGAPVGSENCLTLDVWAPATEGPHPVIVFIHPGLNSRGMAKTRMVQLSMAARHLSRHGTVSPGPQIVGSCSCRSSGA